MRKLAFTLLLLVAGGLLLQAQTRDVLFRKNFPLLHAMSGSAEVSKALLADDVLQELSAAKTLAVQEAPSQEAAIRGCLFSQEEVALAGDCLGALAPQKAFRTLAAKLRKEGCYCLYNELPDAAFLRAAWQLDAAGLNHIIEVYALGKQPYYAAIDAIDFELDGSVYIQRVRDDVLSNATAFAKGGPFYALTLESALAWLDANGRWEAADFEPLEAGINRAACHALPTIQWEAYPYSVIVVLGCGPEKERESISPQSRLRAAYAARLYRQGLAPLLVVSGGRVHPFKTGYSEALEMKKYLISYCGIPEQAILAEPHARHTTTNLRNAVRLMYRNGIPTDKPALVTSSESHIDWVCNPEFLRFGKEQMLVEPVRIGDRMDARTAVFYPLPAAMQVASEDPLDP